MIIKYSDKKFMTNIITYSNIYEENFIVMLQYITNLRKSTEQHILIYS